VVAFTAVNEAGPAVAAVDFQLLRVAQEAVANALKHSGAGRIVVKLVRYADATEIVVEDDGCGFDSGAVAREPGQHFGLRGMQERAYKMAAVLTVRSAPGEGCCVQLRAPLPSSDE
jgi:signal transduction histidine kinase